MPGKKIIQKSPEYLKAWEEFVSRGEINDHIIRPVILDSWKRSKMYGVDPHKTRNGKRLTKAQFKEKYKLNEKLIDISMPFMTKLYNFVKNSGFIVRLSDNEGYVMHTLGDKDIITKGKQLNILPGSNCSEEYIGTNAIGTSIITDCPLQVFAAEHYCRDYHVWTSSACPIHDNNGQITGVLSMTGNSDKVHPHTLGIVVAAAVAIEYQMELDQINRQLILANKHFYAIMESISEGLLSIDSNGKITDINHYARNLMNVKQEDVLGKPLNLIFGGHAKKIERVLNKGVGFSDDEMILETYRGNMRCLVNTLPIMDENEKPAGVVVTFREIRQVHNLVNKMIGAEARFTFNDILGQSTQLEESIHLAKIAAQNNTTVMLYGESGTGKEMFAQAIHNSSARRNGPFVFINCGAIPRELVASELFGYEEGAFTGAKRGGHPGKFELADGGTIFLDEIGDMPLDTQVNLLRVLESRQIIRIGGQKVIPVNVRVIAATNKNLEEEVKAGTFRQDLFYRLNVTPIKIPPLRERKDDIPILIEHFSKKVARQMGKSINRIDEKFVKAMLNYNWPGNVRELQNVLQQVINLVNDVELTVDYLPESFQTAETKAVDSGVKSALSIEEAEQRTIINALKVSGGNVSKAARILGIGRNTLYRKMGKYDIDHSHYHAS
jgi:PAS domain S-box-containing protein